MTEPHVTPPLRSLVLILAKADPWRARLDLIERFSGSPR